MSNVKLNLKRSYVRSLFHAIESGGKAVPKVTFLTSFGYIEGALATIREYDIDNEEAFIEQFKRVQEENGEVKVRDLALAMVHGLVENDDKALEESNVMIYLEDVKIIHNNNTIHMSEFTLFLDQVIGVIPGTINVV
ncbi:hypothetical protein [Bacillus wiedmannii]|uniref:hypothetical protein n=1 Tax=Bacillus wiedmannii TaxID=1890302 RepID=UPI000BEF46C6|nr:hypothetical protein [Bacillus wiedmannii]PEO37005.1 hypothetical protein CN555_20235 [Bacillus wiedmannii]